jgi:Mg/Co/Ni transporter MgtE
MSPRAACRLEALGFDDVYDYVPGKADWQANGLPIEGSAADRPTAGTVSRADVVTCGVKERIGDVSRRVAASPYGFALVTSQTGVLLGRLRRAVLDDEPDRRAGEAMEEGPSTVRPDSDLAALVERLAERDLATAIVTTPDGRLVGVLRRSDAEAGTGPQTR